VLPRIEVTDGKKPKEMIVTVLEAPVMADRSNGFWN